MDISRVRARGAVHVSSVRWPQEMRPPDGAVCVSAVTARISIWQDAAGGAA